MAKKPINNKNNSGLMMIMIAAILIIVAGALYFINGKGDSGDNNAQGSKAVKELALSDNGDLILPTKGVNENADFYTFNSEGTKMGVFVVKAEDGTIRTAFNTCQVCFDSGKGYYLQNGEDFKCQNCGNLFNVNDIEEVKGGCNPVPITSEYKTVEEDKITVSSAFIKETQPMFAKWNN
ncbi:MAG: hypothetical protein K0R18_1042 [Bacillales bacterium]|jgi:uncharacterized membrane protein|nr:hypothetical protein [Bacillales bacterium]